MSYGCEWRAQSVFATSLCLNHHKSCISYLRTQTAEMKFSRFSSKSSAHRLYVVACLSLKLKRDPEDHGTLSAEPLWERETWFTECQSLAVPSDVIYRVRGDLASDLELLKFTADFVQFQQITDICRQGLVAPTDDKLPKLFLRYYPNLPIALLICVNCS